VIGRTLSHYRIEDRLGAGGMGVVYLARDLALGRMVALKVLPEGFSADLRERLMREARACARLQHPCIATFHEAGEDDGAAWLAIEYVRGRTLRQRLADGPLPSDDAVAVAGALLEALAHAHAAGILHRDVKPENVMLAEAGGVKLLDFGLAKRLASEDDGIDHATLTLITSAGAITGTPGYLAPEQIRGEDADGRADLFAVAAVLYESLTGTAAFAGPNPMARLGATLTHDPAPLQPSFPEGLARVVARALARDPAQRPASAGAFLADLRLGMEGRVAPPAARTLAVLDFRNLGGAPADEWIGSGVAESLMADLGRQPGIVLVPREKTLAALRATADPLAAGLRLGCGAVLAGACQRAGDTLRITCRLVEVPTGRLLLSEKVDGPAAAIFELQDRLAGAAAAALRLESHAGVPAPPRAGLTAFEAHARGRRLALRLEKGGFDQAGDLYAEALAAEPAHAGALTGLAMIEALRFTWTTDPACLERAADYARRAIAADPGAGEPHVWMGYALMRSNRPAEAIACFRRAMEIDAGSFNASYFLACAEHLRGRRAAALPAYQQAIDAEPTHAFAWLGLGHAHMELGRLEEARYCFGRAESLEEAPGNYATAGAAGFLGECLRRMNRLAEAREACIRGIAAAERSDHMFRDTFRAAGLLGLGRVALRQGDPAAAATAFSQAAEHLRGRDRTLAGGHLLVQALAGEAQCGGASGARTMDEGQRLFESRTGHDFSWFWGGTDETDLLELARAARVVGRAADVASLLRRAEDAGREMA
jgi:TolB-like protein/Tfp pilus assembly protein PilF